MNLSHVGTGREPPNDFDLIVEMPSQAHPKKDAADNEFGAMFVDRFVGTAMQCPCNSGYVPHTLAEDSDPVDVPASTPVPLISGSAIRCQPLDMLQMADEAGADNEIIPPVPELVAA